MAISTVRFEKDSGELYEWFVNVKQISSCFYINNDFSFLLFSIVTAVPSAKSSVQPGDRVLDINGVKHTEFKTQKRANDLFEMMVLDTVPDEEEEDE